MFGPGPFVVARVQRKTEARVGLREVFIQFNGSFGRLDRGQKTFLRRQNAEYSEPIVIICDARVRVGVTRVGRNGTVQVYEGLCKAFLRERIEVVAAAEVMLEGLGTFRPSLDELVTLVSCKLRQQPFDDLRRELVLEREHIGKHLVDRRRPNRRILGHVEQLYGYAKPVVGLFNASVQDEIDTQFATGADRVRHTFTERTDRAGGPNDKSPYLTEPRDQGIGQTYSQESVIGVLV